MSGAQGSSGQSQPPWLGPNPGRTSYANVAAGVAGSTQQTAAVHLPPATGQGAYSSIYADQPSRIPLPVPADLDAQAEGGTRIPESWASGSGRDDLFNTPHYLQQAFNPWGMWLGSPAMSFFRPTYLRGSKYLEDLEAAYNASIAAQQEEPPRPRSGHGSLSKSSSAVSLPRIQASHRGMTYEIIEHQPSVVVEETGPRPLPSRWQDSDKHGSLAIGEDGHQVRYVSPTKSPDHEAAAARTDHPMPPQAGIYYYEVYIESKGKDGVIGVGFSTSKVLLERLPGWELESWAYHGDDGKSFCCSPTGKSYGPTFASGDVVGCGVNFTDRTAFFTKNGVLLDTAFRDIKETELYPSVGMKKPHAHLVANFGQRPFCFDIDTYVERRQQWVLEEIDAADTSVLHPHLDKDDLCKALVAQYLSHDGYVESAQDFAEEVRRETTALNGTHESPIDGFLAIEEDHDAANRQQIRAAVLDGDIDTTLKLTNAYFPTVLSTHRDINFRVRCRKYIEMIRQATDARNSPTSKSPTNGHPSTSKDNHSNPDQSMDVDDDDDDAHPANQGTTSATAREADNNNNNNNNSSWHGRNDEDDDEMDTSDTAAAAADLPDPMYNNMISRAIIYGQELLQTFADETDPAFREHCNETMNELFGMLAYKDARQSPAARLLESGERVKVAEGLNSAILVTLGKSSSTALERLFKQTAVLTDLISEDGGPGALLNLNHLLHQSGGPQRSRDDGFGGSPTP